MSPVGDHVTAHAYTYFSLLIPGVTAGLSFEDFTGVLLSFIRGAMGSVVGGAEDLCVSVCCREGECVGGQYQFDGPGRARPTPGEQKFSDQGSVNF